MPKSLQAWVYFIAAVFVTGVIINSIARRVPVVQQIAAGF